METLPLPYSSGDVEKALGANWAELMLSAYRWMILGRTLDARMQALQRQGRIGFYGAATGQEAVNVGAALAMTPNDWVFPGLREQLIALVRGHSLEMYLHHLFADDLDPARGRQMPCHPTAREVGQVSMSSVIGTQISQAVGVGYAIKLKAKSEAAVAFFGDGATSANDFHAGLNFAAVFHVPVVFCCTNNQWAISVPVERQTAVEHLSEKAPAYGMPGRRADGTDVVAVYREMSAGLAAARGDGGPSMIEFVLYRMAPHTTSDDPKRYQTEEFLTQALAHDPVARLARWLEENGLLSEERKLTMLDESDRLVRNAIEAAEKAPPPRPETLTLDVFAASVAPLSGQVE